MLRNCKRAHRLESIGIDSSFGGVLQASKLLSSKWLETTFPKQHGSIYIDATHEPHPACDETVHLVMPHFLGWDEKASAKTDPYSDTALKLASEFDKYGFVTRSEPLRAFWRDADHLLSQENDVATFVIGHIKGMASFVLCWRFSWF